jgi:glycogen operon protein
LKLRAQQRRNFLATLFLSQGTPMLLAGDEMARSQNGNNNAYCQDNELSWLDWSAMDDARLELVAFVQRLIAFRKAHPVLRRARFMHGREHSPAGIKDITWLTLHGTEMTAEDWQKSFARSIGILLDGRARPDHTADGRFEEDDCLFTAMNAHSEALPFKLPQMPGLKHWRRVIDTAEEASSSGIYEAGTETQVAGRSLAVFVPLAHGDDNQDGP